MINIGIIGVGNTGNQIVALAKESMPDIQVCAINSSEKDLETIPSSIPRILLQSSEDDDYVSTSGDEEIDLGASRTEKRGAGKDRTLAKKFLKHTAAKIIEDKEVRNILNAVDVVFIISSTGGGTGSGTCPMLANIIGSVCPDVKVILVGVLPVNNEALGAHVNTLEYLNELYKTLDGQTYMLYDNDKYAGLPSYKIIETVNKEIVEDIRVITGFYNKVTKFDSIDDRDMMRLIGFSGRLTVARVMGFSEKDCETTTIEDMIIDNIKRNAHVESQRDKKVMASGIISNLSQSLTEEFDNNIPLVREFVGDPVHAFSHIYVNEDRKEDNNVFLILNGLSPINDKINKISDRIEEIEEKQKLLEEESALDDIALDALSDKIADHKKESNATEVDLNNIFSKFGI